MSRFDYIKYDDQAQDIQIMFKGMVESLEKQIDLKVRCPRSKALAHTKLEEVYMWIGKGIKNDQTVRNNNIELKEERG